MIISPLAVAIQNTDENRKEIREKIHGQNLYKLQKDDWVIYIPGTGWSITMDDRTYLRFFGAKGVIEDCVVKREAEKQAKRIFQAFPRFHKMKHITSSSFMLYSKHGEVKFEEPIDPDSDEFKSWVVEHEFKESEVNTLLRILKQLPWQDYGTITREEVL